ncbi:hypothetical protein P154DRAFT_425636, partial [Amniculicola lignicola CBS 123094]
GLYRVDKALLEAKQADVGSIQRIILEESELAWRIYYAACKVVKLDYGFTG